jgi:integrase
MDRGVFVCRSEAETTSLSDALNRYLKEVVPTKKGKAQEEKRIGLWLCDPLAKRSLASLRSSDFATWRDKRLESVSPATCVRDLALLSHVFTVARTDWGIAVSNPIQSIRKPGVSNARTRRLVGDEESRLLDACRKSKNKHLYSMVVLALETACRQSEIVSLTWSEIDLGRSVMERKDSKNGEGRIVPLTKKALSVLPDRGIGRLYPVFPRKAWESALSKAGIDDFHFHDLRHEAVSRLFERGLNQFEVAAVSGHKTMQMLKRYTHLKPENLLRKMQG